MDILSKEEFRNLTPEGQILYLNRVRNNLKITSTATGRKIDYLDDLGFSDVEVNWKLKPKGGFEPETSGAKAYADAVKEKLRAQFGVPDGSEMDSIDLADKQYSHYRTGDPESPRPTYIDYAESNPESYMNAGIATQPYDKLVETLNRLSDPMYTRYAGHLQGVNKTKFPEIGEVKGPEDWDKVKESYGRKQSGLLEGAADLGNEFPWGSTMSAGEQYNNLSIQEKIKQKVEEKVAIKEATPVVEELIEPVLDSIIEPPVEDVNPIIPQAGIISEEQPLMPNIDMPRADIEVTSPDGQSLRELKEKNKGWDKNNGLKDLEFKAGVFL